jgi:glycosyltransferase involved in cell wall biosynthesis
VHFDTIGLAPYRDLSAGLPATLTHHNIESHMMLRRADNAGNSLARAYFREEGRRLQELERQVAPRFAAHITCSDLDRQRLQEIVPAANTVVVPNGVDCDYFASEGRPVRPGSLVFVGTMNWYPNVQAMVYFLREIWPGLKARVPAVTLDIAGSNPPESLVQMARSLPDVTVHGYLPDVRPLIDSAAIFVCPIRDGGGTKLKILDAFAMKKCVVAHPIACEGIEVTAGKDVVLASTPAEFILEIESLLGDAQRRSALAGAARSLVETRYSYREIGARFNETLEQAAREAVPAH